MDIRTEGLNHLCFPTYYRGPFVASNIANMYCTECIIGIIQNAGTPSRLRFARTRRDEGRIEPPVLSYILQRPIRSVQYCEYVLYRMYYRYHTEIPPWEWTLANNSGQYPNALGSRPVNSHHGYTDKGIEPPVLSYILQRPIRSIQYREYVLYRMLSYRTQELPLGSASPVLGVMREGLNHLCFPTYYRGPFVASNIATQELPLGSA